MEILLQSGSGRLVSLSKLPVYLPTRSFPWPRSLLVYCYSYTTAPNGNHEPTILALHWHSLRLGSVYMHQYLAAQGEEDSH